jgi:hypothetical protein
MNSDYCHLRDIVETLESLGARGREISGDDLMKEVMKKTRGRLNPAIARKIIQRYMMDEPENEEEREYSTFQGEFGGAERDL